MNKTASNSARKTFGKSCLLYNAIACHLAILTSSTALATAPIQQTTNPTPFGTLYSVVDMTSSPTADIGTGSIIGSHFITQGPDQVGYFCVLTADHVIAQGANSIGFGYFGDGTNGANSFSATYPIVKVFRGGSTGNEDLAVAVVRYGTVDPFFTSVKDLQLWTPPATLTLPNMPSTFTEIGYGDTGTPHYASGIQDGFTPQTSHGIQRFDNANPASVNAGAAHGGIYTYTDIKWNPGPVSPGNPNLGTGSSFGGDSGGPYFTTNQTTFTVTGLTDVSGNAVGNQNINAYTDTIFAVHTFGNNNNPQLFSAGIASGGDLLTAADITWINNSCDMAPEPASWVLASFCVAGFAVLAAPAPPAADRAISVCSIENWYTLGRATRLRSPRCKSGWAASFMPSLDPPSEQQSTSSATSHSALAARASLVPPLMLMALLPLGMAYGLYLEGRPWWCACRLPFLWTSDINSRHCSQHLLDPYTFTHLLHGVVLCGALAWLLPRLSVRWRFVAALAVEALWELVENSDFVINRYRTATMALGYEGDSIANSLGDLLACGIGFIIAMRLEWKRSLILFVVTELLLIIWIRDSLFLSALMLIHSFDAIKAWQQGG